QVRLPTRPAMFEHESGRLVALRILHTQRAGDESFGQHARRHSVAGWILRGQCTGESKTRRDRNARKPFAGLVRNIFPGWEHPEIVPYHGAPRAIDPAGCHKHFEPSAAERPQFSRRQHYGGVRPNPGKGRGNFRGAAGPAKFPGADAHYILSKGWRPWYPGLLKYTSCPHPFLFYFFIHYIS